MIYRRELAGPWGYTLTLCSGITCRSVDESSSLKSQKGLSRQEYFLVTVLYHTFTFVLFFGLWGSFTELTSLQRSNQRRNDKRERIPIAPSDRLPSAALRMYCTSVARGAAPEVVNKLGGWEKLCYSGGIILCSMGLAGSMDSNCYLKMGFDG